jgi:hypothetical protein
MYEAQMPVWSLQFMEDPVEYYNGSEGGYN